MHEEEIRIVKRIKTHNTENKTVLHHIRYFFCVCLLIRAVRLNQFTNEYNSQPASQKKKERRTEHH